MKINLLHPLKSVKDRFFYHLGSCKNQLVESMILTDKNVSEMKSKMRSLQGKKINLVFVCHRPVLWSYLDSVFAACQADPVFDVTIVAIPNKKQLPEKGFCHEIYETEGAEIFFEKFPCRVINGYDYETHEWFDLKKLNPDYLFFQTPYNLCRPRLYHADVVAKFAQLCYIHYGLSMLKKDSVIGNFAQSFIQYTSFAFAATPYHQKEYKEAIGRISQTYDMNRIFLSGSPRFDGSRNKINLESQVWKHKKTDNIFRVVWVPRWTENENNCNFREYHSFLYDFAEKEQFDLVFRPHPQAFLNYIAEGIMTPQEINDMVKKYESSNFCNMDFSKNSDAVQYSSDVLVADPSGFVFEYLLTGKPIIYCEKNNDWANDFSKKVFLSATYRVKSAKELEKTLQMLRNGKDPLKEKRQEILQSDLYFPSEGAGEKIKNIIKQHFEGLRS